MIRVRHRLGEHRLQGGVNLNGHDFVCLPAKLSRQRADAGADLQHAARAVHASFRDDALRHPALREKILPLGLGKMKAMPGEQGFDVVDVAKIHKKSAFRLSL